MICNLQMSLHDNSHSVASITVTLLDRAVLKQPNCFFFVRFLLKELNKNKNAQICSSTTTKKLGTDVYLY